MSNSIEQIINEIEDYIDSCKFSPLSTTKIMVNKDELEELLEELKMKTPGEIKKYQRMLANKNGILEGLSISITSTSDFSHKFIMDT